MRVFVYGSLKKGYWNHHYLEHSKHLGSAILFGHTLYHVALYPGMIKSNKIFETVKGELYKIDEQNLQQLDKLEGEGYLYQRRLVTILSKLGLQKAYTYLYLPEIEYNTEKVENNNWHPKTFQLTHNFTYNNDN